MANHEESEKEAENGSKGPSKRRSGSRPWWENKLLVTVFGALLAAILPISTLIQSHYASNKEMDLAKQKYVHELEMQYIDRAIDSDKPLYQRRQMLEFIVATSLERSGIKDWANKALSDVTKRMEEHGQERQRQAGKATQLAQEAKDAEADLRSKSIALIEKRSTLPRPKNPAAPDAVADPGVQKLEKERTEAEAKAVALSGRLMDVQAKMVRLDDALGSPTAQTTVAVPLTVRLMNLHAIEDGTLGRTRWTFEVWVNGTKATSIDSSLYDDRQVGTIALHQTGAGTGTSDQPVELRIIGKRARGGLRAEGVTSVPWAQVGGSPATVRVEVPGKPQDGCFEISAIVLRAPQSS